jgi:hypothetical protein
VPKPAKHGDIVPSQGQIEASHGKEKLNGGHMAGTAPERTICARAAGDRRLSHGARNWRSVACAKLMQVARQVVRGSDWLEG